MACPVGFVGGGAIKGGDGEYCAAGPDYDGPCNAERYKLADLSRKARERWSASCQANWPCRVRERDFTKVGPDGWSKAAGGMECAPPPEYDGPYREGADFTEYNVAMLKRWSSACRAYWKCK